MSSVRALAPRTTMVAGHYLFLLVPFFFLLFVLPLSIESSAVFRAGATFSTSPFRVESLGTAVGSSSGDAGMGAEANTTRIGMLVGSAIIVSTLVRGTS